MADVEQTPAKTVEAEVDAMVIVNGILTAIYVVQNRVLLSNGDLDGLMRMAILTH